MNKPIRTNQFINLYDRVGCHCFVQPVSAQHFFLSKNKSLGDGSPLSPNKIQKKTSNIQQKVHSSKKSLKKQKTIVNENQRNQKSKNAYQEYYPAPSTGNRIERADLRRSPAPHPSQRSVQYKNVFRQNFVENNSLQFQPALPKSPSCQIPKPTVYFNRVVVPPLPTRTIQIVQPHMYYPQVSSRIYLSPQKIVQHTLPMAPRYQVQTIISSPIKPQQYTKTETKTKESIQSQLTLKIPQKREFKAPKILSDRTIGSQPSESKYEIGQQQVFFEENKKRLQQNIFFFKQEPFKPKFQTQNLKQKNASSCNKLNIPTFPSKTDIQRSYIEDGTGRSKITIKKGKQQKPKLKKMDDVQEIKSMNDSQSISDDNQSIVLAKLNEYGSFVDPALSAVDSCPTTFKSRLVYQSSTAENSTVKGYSFNK